MMGLIALIGVIVAAVFAYRTAKNNGRNGPFWALAMLGVGFVFQIVVPMIVGLVLAVIFLFSGGATEEVIEKVETPAGIIGFVSVFLSAVGIWLILRHVSKPPKERPRENVPPPPTFHGND